MNKWSTRRKRIIFLLVFVVLLLLVALPIFLFTYNAPTCEDNKQNGDETGVDCGGSCELLCSSASIPLIPQGDPRILTIAPSVYEVVALFDNVNAGQDIYRARYSVSLFSLGESVPGKVLQGEVYVPSQEEFAVFLGPFTLTEFVPHRAVLEWQEETLVWRQNVPMEDNLLIRGAETSGELRFPQLEAYVENQSLSEVENIEFIALLYGPDGNIFAAGKTFLERLPPSTLSLILFTWPTPFNTEVSNIRILPRIFPDASFIR